MPLSNRARGYALAAYGTLAITPDAVLLRLAEREGATLWVSICAKMAVGAFFCLVPPLCRHGFKSQMQSIRNAPWHFGGTTVLQAIINFFYCIAYLETGVAKALMLISLHPIWSGLGGWRLLGDPLPMRTILALVGALGSMVLMFVPPAIGGPDEDDGGSSSNATTAAAAAGGGGRMLAASGGGDSRGTLHGDLIALAAGIAVACNIILSRHASQYQPDAPLFLGVGLGLLAISVCCLPVACANSASSACSDFLLLTPTCLVIIVSAGFLLANCLLALLVLAPKYISSAEVALVLLLETVLSPLWTYIGVGEEPTVWTLAGGGLLVAVLTLHEVAAMRTEVTAADSEGSGTQKRQQGAAGKEDGLDAAAGAVSAAVVEVTAA